MNILLSYQRLVAAALNLKGRRDLLNKQPAFTIEQTANTRCGAVYPPIYKWTEGDELSYRTHPTALTQLRRRLAGGVVNSL